MVVHFSRGSAEIDCAVQYLPCAVSFETIMSLRRPLRFSLDRTPNAPRKGISYNLQGGSGPARLIGYRCVSM
ncbi:MAG: hypothetical protein KDK37_13810 [Leptospiraceae bacterium]|nr:hypothetical protein [Leptospiraceae bacterium]